jgi:hypothetical protein
MGLLGGDRSEAIFIPGQIAGIRKEQERPFNAERMRGAF